MPFKRVLKKVVKGARNLKARSLKHHRSLARDAGLKGKKAVKATRLGHKASVAGWTATGAIGTAVTGSKVRKYRKEQRKGASLSRQHAQRSRKRSPSSSRRGWKPKRDW